MEPGTETRFTKPGTETRFTEPGTETRFMEPGMVTRFTESGMKASFMGAGTEHCYKEKGSAAFMPQTFFEVICMIQNCFLLLYYSVFFLPSLFDHAAAPMY